MIDALTALRDSLVAAARRTPACENGCAERATVLVELPGRTKAVCDRCAAEGGDPELEDATDATNL